jgi:GT2 family glycosyltransferase
MPIQRQAIAPAALTDRVQVRGKFLVHGNHTFWVKGVTYGPFGPSQSAHEYGWPEQTAADFAQIAARGFNTIRTYTPPPLWLLDQAHHHGLRVMVGLAWEQHIAFLSDRRRMTAIERRVREGVRSCAGHPSILCYSVGNEIPASIARWYEPRQIERFIERLYRAAKAEDPGGLITYVNYPSTEYLQLPFLEFVSFNVYLEKRGELEKYVARLQNLAGERPLVLAEIGLDRLQHGAATQANHIDWQIRSAFEAGCAGAVVFSWTDEWYRGGMSISEWQFGLTDKERRPQPALEAAQQALVETPFSANRVPPLVSVVICTRNGSRTVGECLEHLAKLEYAAYEVIVVDDGSTDDTAAIAERHGARVIRSEHGGLSAARNLGLEAALGEIVAYIDDDAYPDPHWLHFLVGAMEKGGHVGVGGPNLPPPDDGTIAQLVARAPGGPTHVLVNDHEAEHIPGCNMAFKRQALLEMGGFDEQFWIAGDDVDVCWRLMERGGTLGYAASAVVWHHRRGSVRAYWRQQVNYGRAEALLEAKWPQKYNALGHLIWRGRIYAGMIDSAGQKRVRYGTWGSELFQPVEEPPLTGVPLRTIPRMPEWYLFLLTLSAVSLAGLAWPPLRWAAIGLVSAIVATFARAWVDSLRALRERPLQSRESRSVVLLIGLHLVQPLARLWGRVTGGLIPWRARGARGSWSACVPLARERTVWSERWRALEMWLGDVEDLIRRTGASPVRGGRYDRWDLEVRGGLLGATRMLATVEEHGQGRQLLRLKMWPRWDGWAARVAMLLVLLGAVVGWATGGVKVAGIVAATMSCLAILRGTWEAGSAMHVARHAADSLAQTWGAAASAPARPRSPHDSETGHLILEKIGDELDPTACVEH